MSLICDVIDLVAYVFLKKTVDYQLHKSHVTRVMRVMVYNIEKLTLKGYYTEFTCWKEYKLFVCDYN